MMRTSLSLAAWKSPRADVQLKVLHVSTWEAHRLRDAHICANAVDADQPSGRSRVGSVTSRGHVTTQRTQARALFGVIIARLTRDIMEIKHIFKRYI